MDWNNILLWYVALWFITVPLSILLLYFLITELLDLIFNTGKINNLLRHSDSININPLEKHYEIEKGRQSSLTKSILMELDRQMGYIRLTEKESQNRWYTRLNDEVKEKITAAKRVSDIFKIK